MLTSRPGPGGNVNNFRARDKRNEPVWPHRTSKGKKSKEGVRDSLRGRDQGKRGKDEKAVMDDFAGEEKEMGKKPYSLPGKK